MFDQQTRMSLERAVAQGSHKLHRWASARQKDQVGTADGLVRLHIHGQHDVSQQLMLHWTTEGQCFRQLLNLRLTKSPWQGNERCTQSQAPSLETQAQPSRQSLSYSEWQLDHHLIWTLWYRLSYSWMHYCLACMCAVLHPHQCMPW